jgi:hypothetical protein
MSIAGPVRSTGGQTGLQKTNETTHETSGAVCGRLARPARRRCGQRAGPVLRGRCGPASEVPFRFPDWPVRPRIKGSTQMSATELWTRLPPRWLRLRLDYVLPRPASENTSADGALTCRSMKKLCQSFVMRFSRRHDAHDQDHGTEHLEPLGDMARQCGRRVRRRRQRRSCASSPVRVPGCTSHLAPCARCPRCARDGSPESPCSHAAGMSPSGRPEDR